MVADLVESVSQTEKRCFGRDLLIQDRFCENAEVTMGSALNTGSKPTKVAFFWTVGILAAEQ